MIVNGQRKPHETNAKGLQTLRFATVLATVQILAPCSGPKIVEDSVPGVHPETWTD